MKGIIDVTKILKLKTELKEIDVEITWSPSTLEMNLLILKSFSQIKAKVT